MIEILQGNPLTWGLREDWRIEATRCSDPRQHRPLRDSRAWSGSSHRHLCISPADPRWRREEHLGYQDFYSEHPPCWKTDHQMLHCGWKSSWIYLKIDFDYKIYEYIIMVNYLRSFLSSCPVIIIFNIATNWRMDNIRIYRSASQITTAIFLYYWRLTHDLSVPGCPSSA